MRRAYLNRFWLWRHMRHDFCDLTGSDHWYCSCGSLRRL